MDIVYFAWVRERIGVGHDEVEPPEQVVTIADLIGWLAARGGGYAAALADPERLRAAIDQQFAPMSAAIAGAREVAIFPPVTGG